METIFSFVPRCNTYILILYSLVNDRNSLVTRQLFHTNEFINGKNPLTNEWKITFLSYIVWSLQISKPETYRLLLFLSFTSRSCIRVSGIDFDSYCDFDIYTPRNEIVGGYTGFTMSVRLSVRPSVDKSNVVR
jgi:hypothetical protein